MKFLISIGVFALGYVCVVYSKWLVDHIGRSSFFEEKLGAGGTYTFWKLFGVAFLIFGFYYLFNG